jgi:hypothetical protein
MQFRTLPLALVAASALFASADKTLPIEKTSNDFVEISGTLLSKEEMTKLFGSDLGGNIVVVRTTVRPLTEKPVKIDYDDFFLMDTDNGQRSEPYEPSQIAGTSVLVVTPTGVRNGGVMGDPNGPIWGGIGGMPRRGPGTGGGMGNTAGETENKSKVETTSDSKSNPVLEALKKNILPQKEVTDPITGLLYFQIEGKKIKPKNLELHYKTPSGRIAMRFRP